MEGLRSSDLVPARQASPRTNITGAPAYSPGPWAMLQHATTGNTGDNADGFRRPLSPRWAPRAPPELRCQVIGPAATGAGLGRALPSSLTKLRYGWAANACTPACQCQPGSGSADPWGLCGNAAHAAGFRFGLRWEPIGAAGLPAPVGCSVVATHRMCMNLMLDGSSMELRNDGPSFSGTRYLPSARLPTKDGVHGVTAGRVAPNNRLFALRDSLTAGPLPSTHYCVRIFTAAMPAALCKGWMRIVLVSQAGWDEIRHGR